MLHSFPNIKIGLMVGIGGGVPGKTHDIRLGDVVVSSPRAGYGGVLQYDFGKPIQNQTFYRTRYLNQPLVVLRAAVSGLIAQYEEDGIQIDTTITNILGKKPRLKQKYKRPNQNTDKLYRADITHPENGGECTAVYGDDTSNLICRAERTEIEDNPAIHYGTMASGNQLMKDALVRDAFTKEANVLCFEMDAAGWLYSINSVQDICHKNPDGYEEVKHLFLDGKAQW
jgi:nucleoside phosphorylase